MKMRRVCTGLSAKYLAAPLALLFFVCAALCDDPPKSPPANPAAKGLPKVLPPTKLPIPGAGTPKSPSSTAPPHGAPTNPTYPAPSTTRPTQTPGHPAASQRPAPSLLGGGQSGPRDFGNRAPAPKGQTTVRTKTGGSLARRPDGKVATLRDPNRGMEVHHSLSGNRVTAVERSDHSRVVAERGGRGYVQRPYTYHGREYARRSYYYGGHYYHYYYGRYYYRGVWVNPYFASYYYQPAFYGWVYNPWIAAPYAWGWGIDPWYGYYGAFFTPSTVYASPSLWLTDYIIAKSLADAYQAQVYAEAAALSDTAPLTTEVRQLIADEVRQQVALENTEAKAAQGGEPDAASSSIQRALTDGRTHVFLAGHDLDVVDAGGTECALSEGDALQLTSRTAPDAQAATLAVLASKGGKECPKGDTVSVAFEDLQDMQNHMRETIDQGLRELLEKQGQGGLPAAPAGAAAAPQESPVAAAAPPPPPASEVAAEIGRQRQEADKAEAEAATRVNPDVGQTLDQVTAALGSPQWMVNLDAKKIWVYEDMKVTFKDGKVAGVQ
jgi:hypothetical protein